MNRWFVAFIVVTVLSVPNGFAANDDATLRIRAGRKLEPGMHSIIINVYASNEASTPLATERRSIRVDSTGAFTALLTDHLATATEPRWVGVEVVPGIESSRVKLPATSGPVTLSFAPLAAISANGIVESASGGFRFPDGSVQLSAATVSGGVPSVNGIGTAVTIQGAGTTSVSTVQNVITVAGTGVGVVNAGAGLTGGTVAGTATLSAAFGTPVSVAGVNAPGTATTVARADHAHAHGPQAGGNLHPDATSTAAGFLSAADKTRLDSIQPVRTIMVHPVPGDPVGSGAALLAALSGISGNTTSETYLLKLEPGVYDIGTGTLTMKSYVDIEGSGPTVTEIVAARSSNDVSFAAAIVAADRSELRHLTLRNNADATNTNGIGVLANTLCWIRMTDVDLYVAGGANGYGLYFGDDVTATIDDVRVEVFGPRALNTGLYVGRALSGNASTVDLRYSTIRVAGGTVNMGIVVDGTATIDSSTITVSGSPAMAYGIVTNTDTAVASMRNSVLRVDSGTTRYGIYTTLGTASVSNSLIYADVYKAGGALRVATSLVTGTSTGAPTCVGAYDASYGAINNMCVGTCPANFGNCDNDTSNGCESPLNTATNCATCGTPCAAANATTSCSTGTCVLAACNAGFYNCDGNPSNGCESSGPCSCPPGFGNCDGNSANGCETALNTLSNCGACGTTCSRPHAASTSCSTGTCVIGACSAGWFNCDGNPDNGCESSVPCGGALRTIPATKGPSR